MTAPRKPPALKLARLPDRKPVKMTITLSAELAAKLNAYAEAYREAYGEAEAAVDLVPFIIEAYVEGDRGFAPSRKKKLDLSTV